MKLLTQIFLASLIIVKIVLGSIFVYCIEHEPLSLESHAIASEPQQVPQVMTGEDEYGSREANLDLDFLLKKKAELKQKEAEVSKKKEELLAIQEQIDHKLQVLTQLRDEIRAEMDRKRNEARAQMERKKAVAEQKIKHLIKAYSAMKPQKAASLIEQLDLRFAIELLSKMKGDVVGTILSFVNIEKAARISEGLAKR